MPTIFYNLEWMLFNLFLASLGVAFAILLYKTRGRFLLVVFFILWLLFVPNTIYILTDLKHIPGQFVKLELLFQLIIILQYLTLILLGMITFYVSYYLFEKSLPKLKVRNQKLQILILVLLNYLIAFGVALGRFERTHSWFIFTEPQTVLMSSLNLLQSPVLMLVIFLFGTLINLLYFILRKLLPLNDTKI